jgi:hypothetical protein
VAAAARFSALPRRHTPHDNRKPPFFAIT